MKRTKRWRLLVGSDTVPDMPKGQFKRTRRPLEERLWSRVTKTSDGSCWLWNGYRTPLGYGQISVFVDGAQKLTYTHRAAWEVSKGPVAAGLCVLHKCDNPRCCNPDHLFLGSKKDNSNDMASKGRSAFHRLTKRQTVEILCNRGVVSGATMSRVYGVNQTSISRILSEQTGRQKYAAAKGVSDG